MRIERDSQIVEVFSKNVINKFNSIDQEYKPTLDVNELKEANDFIRELAENPTPDNRHELSEILRYVIDESYQAKMAYLDLIADVKNTGINELVDFQLKVNGIVAYEQAISSSTRRSKNSYIHVPIDKHEISVRPTVDFLKLKTGEEDLTMLAKDATLALETKTNQLVERQLYSAFNALNPSQAGYNTNFNVGADANEEIIKDMIFDMSGFGTPALLGDMRFIHKLTALTGFNNRVAEKYMVESNENGFVGTFMTANVLRLNNQPLPNQTTKTVFRKDLAYIFPTGVASDQRPVKVQFAGGLQYIDNQINMDNKRWEVRYDQHVGVGVAGIRKLLGVYQDTTLTGK